MTILRDKYATVITGVHIQLHQLLTQRAALRLEIAGLRFGKGSVSAAVARVLKLPGRPTRKTVLKKLEETIIQWYKDHPENTETGK